MDCFKKLEALIDAGGANLVAESRTLLAQFKGTSQELAGAVERSNRGNFKTKSNNSVRR